MKQLRLLIADDDLELRKWLRLVFRPLVNVEITEATNGVELLSCLTNDTPFDVVITDIRMPLRSGLDVAMEVRTLGVGVPIIFITGYGDAAVEEAVGKLRPAVLMRKPVDNIDLLEHVRQFLSAEETTTLVESTRPAEEPENPQGGL